jgi:two-component system, chemotaxis family, CheB/CheR fusion protein
LALMGGSKEKKRISHRTAVAAARNLRVGRSSKVNEPLTMVGIGASAGGLDPCRRFFSAMPADSGIAFVVIQHLDPVHKSEMAPLLGRTTRMPVVEASDGLRVEGNHVYVIPPNKSLAIRRGHLRLSEPAETRGQRMAIDFFFRSLAVECKERAIGIVLSGTGSDGTHGIQMIRAAGGLAIAQDPESSEHEGMPRSAIGTGVDFILPVEQMPDVLLKYSKHPYVRRPSKAGTGVRDGDDALQSILNLLRMRSKFNFGSYKRGTLERRVQRRMSLRHIVEMEDYLKLLRQDNDEMIALQKDLLICVTHFFREPEAWKALQELVMRPFVKAKKYDKPVRVWVPGCATGEEAYSMAMLLLDELTASKKDGGVQIFASDVNHDAFATARLGLYPVSIAEDISPRRLGRYFLREGDQYRVRKELRDSVVFAEHNLLADPPCSRLDLISCRNLMIYLDPPAQQKLISLFHYALREGGFLFLGSAETVGEQHDLFRPVSRKWRIYRRIGPVRREAIDFPLDGPQALSTLPSSNPPHSGVGSRFIELAQQLILDRHCPPCVVVNRKHEILYTCGPTQDYLTQPAGVMNTDLLAWVSDAVRSKLRAALVKVRSDDQTITLEDVRFGHGKSRRTATITIEPLKSPRQADGLILITFRKPQPAVSSGAKPTAHLRPPDDESLVHQLEDELKVSREDLQSTIDQLASSNQELKASNEEVTSVNEELQSTNEELETSKEEMQSLNEELSTVNNQLQGKVEELEAKTNDLNNLLSSTDIATIFLDRRFQIKWFTTPTTRLLRLRPSDIGRPIGDFAQKFTGVDLLKDAEEVLRKSRPVDREIRGVDGLWYLRRVVPCRAAGKRLDGTVVTFVDINASKLADERLRRLATVVRDSNDAVTVQDFDGRILAWNHGAEVMFGFTEKEALGRSAMRIVPREQRGEMRQLFERLKRGEKIESLETQRRTKRGKLIEVWLTITAMENESGHVTAIATTERDISDQKRAQTDLHELNQNLEKRVSERSALAEQQAERLRELAAQLLTTEEQERRNLAADLHDNLAQVLYVAKMKLSELRSVSDAAAQEPLVQEIEALMARANQSARSLSYQLSPPVLHELGLVPALEWLGEEMKRLYRLDVKVEDHSRGTPLGERTGAALFRVVRELLVNVAKHAGVRKAHVMIRRKGDHVVITVEDRGSGFDTRIVHDPKKNRGLGLFNVRERLDYLGGAMDIRSVIGKKTTVTLTMPVVAEHKADGGRRR